MAEVISLNDSSVETVFGAKDFQRLIAKNMGYDAEKYFEETIKNLQDETDYIQAMVDTDLNAYESSLKDKTYCFQDILELSEQLKKMLAAPKLNKQKMRDLIEVFKTKLITKYKRSFKMKVEKFIEMLIKIRDYKFREDIEYACKNAYEDALQHPTIHYSVVIDEDFRIRTIEHMRSRDFVLMSDVWIVVHYCFLDVLFRTDNNKLSSMSQNELAEYRNKLIRKKVTEHDFSMDVMAFYSNTFCCIDINRDDLF